MSRWSLKLVFITLAWSGAMYRFIRAVECQGCSMLDFRNFCILDLECA